MQNIQKWARKAEVKARYAANDRQLAEMQAAGFPKPVYFGPRSPRWSVAALDEFDRQVQAGELVVCDANAAAALTAKARGTYQARVATGEVRASRQATAARKRAEVPA